jgi:hypothetical protein
MTVQRYVLATLLSLCVETTAQAAPTGLLANFQKSPALGVTATPHFTWIVPGAPSEADHAQTSYTLNVSRNNNLVWSSGRVASNESTYVPYGGPRLLGGTPYTWTVETTTAAAPGATAFQRESAPSTSATFVTALYDGWSPAAKFISLVPACVQNGAVPPQVNCSMFGYFRKQVALPPGTLVSASAFVTAQNWRIYDSQVRQPRVAHSHLLSRW